MYLVDKNGVELESSAAYDSNKKKQQQKKNGDYKNFTRKERSSLECKFF